MNPEALFNSLPPREQLTRFLPRLGRFAYTLTRSHSDADDLVQNTLEKALTRLDQWQPGSRLDSWLYRIAQNLWIDQRRAERGRGRTVDLDAISELVGEDGRDLTERQFMLRDAARALALLPEEQRVVVSLVSIEGLPYAETAEILGVPIGTVMSRLARARKTIAAYVLSDDRRHQVGP